MRVAAYLCTMAILCAMPIHATQLLLHMDGTGQTFVDSSGQGHSITTVGDVTQTAEGAFFGKSAKFDGNGDYLMIPDSSDWTFGSGDFTIDYWIYAEVSGNTQVLVSHWKNGGGNQRHVETEILSSGKARFYLNINNVNYSVAGSTNIYNGWHHIANVRHGNMLKIFVDGTLEGSRTISGPDFDITAPIKIGGYDSFSNYSSYDFHGYLDEFRITKGEALFTENFTPTTPAVPEPLNFFLFLISLICIRIVPKILKA